MAAMAPQKKHWIEWCFFPSWEKSFFVSLCRKMISLNRLLIELRRKHRAYMLTRCVRIPRTCPEIWSSHTPNMNNDLMKNHQLAWEENPIPRACAAKNETQRTPKRFNFAGGQIKKLSVYVIRVCEKSTSLCRKMHSNRHLWEGCSVQNRIK